MSMIYKEGTASLTKGSPVLKGKDTYFLNPIFNVGVGQIVQVKSGDTVYVNSIKEVVDNETLILSFDSFEDVSDGEVVIMITMVDSISDTANKLLGMTRGLVQFETEMTRWFTSMDKKITITLPDGTKKEVYTLQAIMEQVAQNEKEMQELLQNSEKKVNDMVDKAQEDVNNIVTDGTNKINQAVDKADKEINEAITSGTGKIDTMLTESQKKIDKTVEDTEVKVDTELGKIDEKIGDRIDGKVDKSGDVMSGVLETTTKVLTKSINGQNSLGFVSSNSGSANIEKVQGDATYYIRVPQKTGTMLIDGDYGLGSGPTSNDISPPFPTNADNATNSGFYAGGGTNSVNYYDKYSPLWTGVRQGGDGSGTVVQFQFSADGKKLACRVRDRNTWGNWLDIPSKHVADSQFFKGQLLSFNGIYSMDELSNLDYFGMRRAVKGDPYGFFLSYNGSGHTIKFPYKMGGDIVLTNTGSSPNVADNRVLLFRAEKEGQAAYIEYQKPDGSQRWRVGSMGNNTNIALTTGGGGILVLDADGCSVNGRKSLCEGDYGVGGLTPIMGNNDLKTSALSGLFRMGGGADSNLFTNHGCGIHLAYSTTIRSGLFVNSSTGVAYSYTSDDRDTNGIVRTRIIYSTANTTTDSNGFIKKASPIIEIFNSGKFNTNDESEGSSVKKLKEGVYLIKGVLGLHSDKSWGGEDGGIEIPLDNNKLPMIWVDYEVESDGSIILKTYHREHKDVPPFARNLKRGYKDGDPCDIPTGRFVSVRVNMPEDSIYNKKIKEESDLIKEMESNPFYKEERAFPNIIFNKKGDL